MSSIVFWQHGDGRPVEPEAFAAMMSEFGHRPGDGSGSAVGPGWRLGVHRFWTTPEEVGEAQPLRHPTTGLTLAFDGRLDNRSELLDALGLAAADGLSDAAIVLAAFQRWQEACFARCIGPFAAVVVDDPRRRVVCARDPLGDRTLVYAEPAGTFLAASEERALLAHPGIDAVLDERTVARYLAVLPPAEGDTFYARIHELPPAHLLIAENGAVRLERYWELDLEPLRYRRDEEYAEHLRELLERAVRSRLRATTRAGVLMSGGLDSTTVAAMAATAGSRHGSPLAVSWVFDELPGADERRFMRPVVERYGLEWLAVTGDDAWPLCPDFPWKDDPNGPGEAPARALWARTTAVLDERGIRVLLTGDHGDHLYFGSEYWLAALLAEGRLLQVAHDLLDQAVEALLHRRPPAVPLVRAVARLIGVRRRSSGAARPWLTPRAAELVGPAERPSRGTMHEHARRRVATDPWATWGLVAGHRAARRHGLDLRRPFRDRRVIEYIARVPDHCLFRPGWTKWTLRQATRGLLPEGVRLRRWRSSHLPFVARGLAERGWARAESILKADDVTWPRYVVPDRLWSGYPSRLAAGRDGGETVLAWHCLCLERWLRFGRRDENWQRQAAVG